MLLLAVFQISTVNIGTIIKTLEMLKEVFDLVFETVDVRCRF